MNLPTTVNISISQIDQFTENFQNLLIGADKRFVKRINIKDDYLIMSERSLSILREKRRLCRIKNRNRNNVDIRRNVNGEIKLIEIMLNNSLRDDFTKLIDNQIESIDDSKRLFNYIKRVTPHKGNGRRIQSLFLDVEKTNEIVDDNQILNASADTFV